MSPPLFSPPEPRAANALEPSSDSPTVSAELERDLLAILAREREPSEMYEQAFGRKELAFTVRCGEVPVAEALALHQRLANPRPDDVLAEHFGRLVVDRRNRILAFLAAARRRAALATLR